MKKIILVYLSLISFVSFAQIKGDVTIEWLEKKEMSFGDFKVTVPQFRGSSYYFDFSKKAIIYTLKISESASFDENDLQITNIVYEPIPTSQLGELALECFPKQIGRAHV